ncbi:MAG: hypothetical protein NTX42_06015 [Methanothrix sp.]|nr:hypothetical protein [Methanothrix sp.]
MRIIVLTLMLALALGTAQATPLQGSDGNATVVLFGATRTPLEDENATQEILKVDVGLMGTENATYQLVDANNNIYLPGLYKPLSSGKQLVYFLVPKDSLFKLINATPESGKPININWWATPKGSNDRMVLRYYGITDWLINPDEQGIVVQVRVQNNGTQKLIVSPENFTLLDQWGWPYRPTLGFDAETIEPKKPTSRVLLGFTGISLLSRPVALAYDNGASNQIIIMFERDYAPLSDAAVYGANATKSAASVVPAPAAVLPTSNPAAQNVAVQAPAKSETTGTKKNSINDTLAASKARLAAMKVGLNKKTPNTNVTANTSSNASNSSSSISA